MAKQTEVDKLVQAEVSRLQQDEDNKWFLMDKTVGGANAPRPTDDFIKKSLGPQKSEDQIRREAQENVMKQREAERQEAQRRQDVERSMREHTQRVQQQRVEQQRAQNPRDRGGGGRDRGR